MPIIKSKYKAQFFLKNPHVQTILGFFLSKFRVIASNLASAQLFGKNKGAAALVFQNPSETNKLKTTDGRLFYNNNKGIIE